MPESATADTGEHVPMQTPLTTGLRTEPDLAQRHPSLRVTWIEWHSAFRGTGLRIGDHIIAVDGISVGTAPEPYGVQRLRPLFVGQPQETERWQALGAQEDTPVTLSVRRRRVPGEGWQTLEFQGRLRKFCLHRDSSGSSLLGLGGPAIKACVSFDFSTPWGVWYGKFLGQISLILDDTWRQPGWDGASLFEEPAETQLRVDFLMQHYPGPFSQSVLEDWEAARARIGSRRFKRTGTGTAYREGGPPDEPPCQKLPRPAGLPPDTASPREVFDALVGAIQAEDCDTFKRLFISWRVGSRGDGSPLYYPSHEYNLDRLWTDFHWLVTHRAWEARVVWTGDVYTLMPASPPAGVPRVDAVDVQLEHLGMFHGGPRAWPSGVANPYWELQRLDGGPWRISSLPGL